MNKIIGFVVIVAIGLYYYKQHNQEAPQSSSNNSSNSHFACDGRTHCSHMTSCAEAIYFLENCPGVKMDGNNDGVPCEGQWCN
jgi:hypothetical protein